MAKKIIDKNGNVYIKRKPFYKKIWFIILLTIVVVGITRLSNDKKDLSDSSNVEQTEVKKDNKTKEEKTEKIVNQSNSNDVSEVFVPQDSSNETIEAINTYEDYLTMYEFILNEYIQNFEAAVEQYGLGDDATYQELINQNKILFEEQKKQYGPMKNQKIIGKESLVEFLKEYRDELKAYTDQLAAGI